MNTYFLSMSASDVKDTKLENDDAIICPSCDENVNDCICDDED